jgi:predicted nuclease of predicted toxin-antitoxin system
MAVRLKMDENLPHSAAMLLRAAGHDVITVLEQKLGGHADPRVIDVCRTEARALVTLDRGLGNIRAYPPGDHQGIVVLRPDDQSIDAIVRLMERLIGLLERNFLSGALWIIDERRFRIRR